MPDKVLSEFTGADLLVKSLTEMGIEKIFCITGAGNLAVVDAITRNGSISVIYSHHEQAAVMEAQGYSRITNKLGVALVTTGGGTSNVVTGILSAHLDSIPVLLISGNESSFHCENTQSLRAYGVQGFDSCAVLTPVSKLSKRITSTDEIPRLLHEAMTTAMNDRKGPTHIDFPMDLQRKKVDFAAIQPNIVVNPGFEKIDSKVIEKLIMEILTSRQPLIYFGNGIRSPKSINEAKKLIEKLGIPYISSWSAIDIFPESDELNVGRAGIYGDRHANILIQKSDLIIAIGTRLAIPQIGYDKSDFGRKAKKWVVEIDPSECSKFDGLGWTIINTDARLLMSELNDSELPHLDLTEWKNVCSRIKKAFPRRDQLGPGPQSPESQIHSGEVIDFLNTNLDTNAIVSTDVGAALLTGHFMYEQSGNRRFFTSQGLGEMGFGLPGSIGAHFADPSRQIVCLNTDGALMFNLQELQVVREHEIPLKLFVFNNFGYSMIRISQDNLFDGRLAGSTIESGVSFPNFTHIANTFGFNHTVISRKEDLVKIAVPLKSGYPELIEIIMDPEQRYYPRLATNRLEDGSFISPPLEDLDPKIDISLLEEALGYKAHPNSYKARGF
jgi:acetolactate synthase-1/2/3 large subunit